MTLASGLGAQVGFKKEGTWGSAETVALFVEFDSETFTLDPTYYESTGLRANRTFQSSSKTRQTTRQAGGAISMEAPTKQLGFFIDQMVQGTITPVVDTGASYTSTFNIGSSQPNKSSTIQFNKPTTQAVDKAFTYTGSVLTEAAFSLETGGALTCATTWASRDELLPSTTPAGPALVTAGYTDSIAVWVHTDVVTLTIGGVAAAAVTGINWTWTQPYKLDRFWLNASGVREKPIPNGFATVTGTLVAEWYDESWYTLFRSGAFAALVFTVQHPTAIVSTFKPQFKNTFSAIQIRGGSPQIGGPDILTSSIPFVARDNGTNPPWKVEITSTDSAAW